MAPKITDEAKKEAIQQLRERISSYADEEYFKSDGYLLNWLADKKFKVDKAEKALRLSFQWRIDNKINSILEETFDESWLPSQYEFIGHDKQGRPLVISYSKYAEVTEQMASEAIERALKDKANSVRYSYFIAEMVGQKIRDAVKISNSPVNSITGIIDMKSVKFTEYTKYVKKVIPLALDTLKTFENNYPGILNEVYVVNAPKKAIRLVIAMLRPMVNGELLDKIHVYGRKPEKWYPILLEKIDANVLPCRFGGTKDDVVQSADL